MVNLLIDGVFNMIIYGKSQEVVMQLRFVMLEPEAQTLLELSLYDHASLIWVGFIYFTADWLPLYARGRATDSSLVS